MVPILILSFSQESKGQDLASRDRASCPTTIETPVGPVAFAPQKFDSGIHSFGRGGIRAVIRVCGAVTLELSDY